MRRFAVPLVLAISFVFPLALPTAHASEPGTVQASSSDTSCRRRPRPKKQSDNKPKKKDKKPYGFEL